MCCPARATRPSCPAEFLVSYECGRQIEDTKTGTREGLYSDFAPPLLFVTCLDPPLKDTP